MPPRRLYPTGLTVFVLCFVFFWGNVARAQSLSCTTPTVSPDSLTYAGITSAYDEAPLFCDIRLNIHILRQTDGSGGRTTAGVDSLLAILVADFATESIDFEISTVNPTDNSTWFSDPISNTSSIFQSLNSTDAIDLVLGPESGLAQSTAVQIPSTACIVTGTIVETHALSHAVAHCLGLLHSDETVHGTELPDGSNGATAGDLVAGTAADPGLSGYIDANGQLTAQFYIDFPNHNPDPGNIMCSAPLHAWTDFNEEQGARMRAATAEVSSLQSTIVMAQTLYFDDTTATGMSNLYQGGLSGRPYNAAGFDINRDGNKDLVLTQANKQAWVTQQFSGNGTPYFVDQTNDGFRDGTGPDESSDRGTIYADYDNDGWMDLYVPNSSTGHRLYRYNPLPHPTESGTIGFEDVTTNAGLSPLTPSSKENTVLGSWADYDGDGDLDLLVNVAHSDARYHSSTQILFRNDPAPANPAKCTFTDVTATTGFTTATHIGSTLWGDYDGDSDLDLVMVQHSNPFYISSDHSSYLRNDINVSGVESFVYVPGSLVGRGKWRNEIFAAVADANNDAELDIIYTKPDTVGVFSNSSGTLSSDVHQDADLDYADPRDIDVFDFELDGRIDVTMSNAYPFPILLRNNEDSQYAASFAQVSNNAGINVWQRTERVSVTDFNLDGFGDVFLTRDSAHRFFFKAMTDPGHSANHWIGVRLRSPGDGNNYYGIGARVVVTRIGSGETQAQIVDGGKSGPSQGDLDLVFGLGEYAGSVLIKVYWPDGTIQQKFTVQRDTYHTIFDSAPPIDSDTVEFKLVYHLGTAQVDWVFTWETFTHPLEGTNDTVTLDLTGLSSQCLPSRYIIADTDQDTSLDVSMDDETGQWVHTLTWIDTDCLPNCPIPYTVQTGVGAYSSQSTGHELNIKTCLQ